MKPRRAIAVLGVAALGVSIASTAVADDGDRVSKSMSHQAQATIPGYLDEAEHAFIGYMKFYVPAQKSDGTLYSAETDDKDGAQDGYLTYLNVDGEIEEQRDYAKPMVGVYMFGPYEEIDGVGFVGHGRRDAYAAVSLDDGVTWKDTNLSESADLSSSDVIRTDIPLFSGVENNEEQDYAYPGDVINMFHSISGNNVLVAWPSRFCSQGQPNYSLDNPDASPEQIARREGIAAYLGIDLATASTDDLYLIDMYGVGGQQGSVDYSEDKFEQNQPVGEVPYACLWTARGELIDGDDPRTEDTVEESFMRWFKAERLTSGRRDVNRVEVQCTDAGCAITWQEDPDGLRAGQGEGPGEGWSGAVAWSGTDVWYSYIDMQNFDVVQDPADETGATPMTLADYEATAAAEDITQKPKPFVPMAMPMRLTDNEKCNPENPKPYCNGSAISADFPELLNPLDYGLKDMCAALIDVPTGQNNELKPVCVSAAGVPNIGNTAATRPRLGLYAYDSADTTEGSATFTNKALDRDNFVVVVAEEDKGLGKFGFKVDDEGVFLNPLESCEITKGEGEDEIDDPDGGSGTDQSCQPFDEGKNITYFSFAMGITDLVGRATGGNSNPEDRLLVNLTQRGDQLNQPEVLWRTGEFYGSLNTSQLWDFGEYNFDIYNTEIARRGSLLAQDIAKARNSNAKAGLVALPTWKQGTMNQGGPADVMARRIVMPNGTWSVNKGNPYAFTNMECIDERGRSLWKWNPNDNVRDGTNPYYPNGLCLASATNLSATIPDSAVEQSSEADPVEVLPPQVDFSQGTTFGVGDTNPILFGLTQQDSNTTKVLSWHQCPASFTTVTQTDGTVVYTCDNDLRTDDSTLEDQSWYNPLEVAKGHRGYLDGDMVMVLYAWSPNYRLNAKGNDRYELYVRRSFDGATSWTTTPSKGKDVEGVRYDGDGTVTCETWRSDDTQQQGDQTEPRVCNSYAAGAAEQARNVTQIQSMKTTTLDPRFAMTGSPYGVSVTSSLFGITPPAYTSGTGDSEDVRDASRYFIVYETGDNTTTEFGEPEPLDLFYSRAVNWGDDYVVWDETAEGGDNAGLGGCYPSDPHADIDPETGVPTELIGSGFCNEFDQVDQGTPGLEASEASLQANPGGEFLYAAWAQLEIDEDTGEDVSSDAMARRIWWIDGWLSATDAWVFGQGSGDGTPANP